MPVIREFDSPVQKGVGEGDRTEPPGHVTPRHLPQGHIPSGHLPPGHLPRGHLPLGHIPPSHLPPGHLPPGHLPSRTYTPRTYTTQTLKCPIWFMHHVLITYCTLKKHLFCRNSIYLGIGAINLTDICSVRKV